MTAEQSSEDILGAVQFSRPAVREGRRSERNAPPKAGSEEYLHKLRGCSLKIDSYGAPKCVLPESQTKLQSVDPDEKERMQSFTTVKYEARKNAVFNQIPHLPKERAKPDGISYTISRVGGPRPVDVGRVISNNLYAVKQNARNIKALNSGTQGRSMLYHEASVADWGPGEEQSVRGSTPGHAMKRGKANKERDEKNHIEFVLPEKPEGYVDWRSKYKMPPTVFEQAYDTYPNRRQIKLKCGASQFSLREGTPDTSEPTKAVRFGRRAADHAKWGEYPV